MSKWNSDLELLYEQLCDDAVLKLSYDKTITREAHDEHFGRVHRMTITTNEYIDNVCQFNYTDIKDDININFGDK